MLNFVVISATSYIDDSMNAHTLR